MSAPYGKDMADVYDLVYASRGKDYPAEVAALVELIRARAPQAKSLLDVACGTGEHLRHLRGAFADLEGLELSEPMRTIAMTKLPDVVVHAGDMRNFRLGRTFDVVACLFSSIGYARSGAELAEATQAMANHLDPGGLLIIDPWFYAGEWTGGHLDHTVALTDNGKVLRLAQSSLNGRTSQVTYHYLVGDSSGVNYFVDIHEMALFTKDEYATAIRSAGCDNIQFLDGWAAGRGRIVAVKA